MKTLSRLLLIAFLALTLVKAPPAQANAGEYTFTVSLGTYDDISDDPGYIVSTATGDDVSQAITLPFTFKYDTVDYTTGLICTNGWLEMGQSYTTCMWNNNLASTTVKPILAPLWDDLADDATSEIGYITLGGAPDRTFVVQWKDVTWPYGRQNFQVRLHETTNVIEFVYGTMTKPDFQSVSASIGINDATGGSGHFLSVTPAAGTADTASSTTANNDIRSAEYLTSGKTYTFTPPVPAAPGCAINPVPANGATEVPLAANLSWGAATGAPTGYKLFFGTNTPPTNIVDGTDLGNVTAYDPAADLTAATPYYWQVVPYNANGDATGCPVWSFTSEPTPLSAFPYEESFESSAGGWTSGGTSSTWELGAPADDVINSAAHSSRAWTTGLTADYNLDEQSYVRSPGFDFSGLTSPAVLLDVWWESEYPYDGAALQYSTDGGVTWTFVGQYTDPQNWYTVNDLTPLYWAGNNFFIGGWTGNDTRGSQGWRTAGHSLAALAGQRSVRLRVVFGSDYSTTDDGFAFDRVRIFDNTAPPPCTTGLGPADGATDVLLNAALKWDGNSSSLVTGYTINFGTDDPPMNLRDHINLGSVTTYDWPGYMEAMKTHRWQIIPYNSVGEATGCPVYSFTTGSSATLLDESFDGATIPSNWNTLSGGACAWYRTTAGLTPPQAPHSPRYEMRFNSYSCDADEHRQLMAPAVSFSAAVDYALRFWMYHDAEFPGAPDRMQIQVTLNNGATVADVGAPIPRYAATTGWRQHEVDLSAYAGQPSVRAIFKGISGYGNDVFMDDAQVVHSTAVAAPNCAVLVAPGNGAASVLVNADLDWATGGGAPAGYRLALGTDNPPTNIVANADLGKVTLYNHPTHLAGGTAHYWRITPYNTFGDAADCPVWSFTTGATPLSAFPYVEGFEGGAAGWTSGGVSSSWALGTPAGAVIQGAAGGSKAWMTGLSAAYNNDEQSYVQSPAFDLSGLAHPYVKFDLWWDAEDGSDGAQLQISADGGQTWVAAGYYDPGLDWYNATVTGLLPGWTNDGWSGAAAEDALVPGMHQAGHGWRTALYSLEDYAGVGHVLLRFFFGADDASTYDGFAFDNFEIRAGCAWTGAASDDWHAAGNWDCGHVPGAAEIAYIPADTATDPVIRAAAAAWAVGLDGILGNGRTLTLDGGSLAVGGALVNHSALRQTQAVNGAAVTFFDAGGYGGLTINPNGQNLGATAVQIRGNQACTTVPGETVRRCFDIAPGAAPASGVTLTFYFAAYELPSGMTCATVEAYHWNGAWSDALAVTGRNCAAEPYSITISGVTDFSPFVLKSGSAPNAVAVREFAAVPGLPVTGLIAALGLLAAAAVYRLLFSRKSRA